jgi:predicted Abi (CAAX) family protease
VVNLAGLLIARMGDALLTPLDPGGVALTLALLGLYAATAIPLGLHSGFLQRRWRPSAPRPLLRQALTLMVMPSLGEELLFRAALLPRPGEAGGGAAGLLWAVLGLALFVGYHPLAGRLWYRLGRNLFDDPRFLGLCALLGLVCTIAYLATASLLAPLLIHWLVVLIWLEPLGGRDRLHLQG